ncbi:hypothetical protein SAMN05443633_101131 [Chryseobacterium arachidis]|uniref:Uncharacterized protein n=1 Tax=Chryseobacterium arachidis TaxID=1416778 RepID=A0A1M4T1R7_9FLAO|nr:hypothetical protein [Chryseobacterium arachidis]SHE38364.1 hypothetical protein SAMN05443633_101131 [Chryseobacterium arachidis]
MSRTRIVKGKIFEAVEQDYTIYSESDIIDSSAEIVSEKGAEKGVSYGTPSKPSAGEIKAKCLVQFRPHDQYMNTPDFGFDWLRQGDSGQKGDEWFGAIMGRYFEESTFVTPFQNTNGWTADKISNPDGYFKKELSMYDKKLKSYKSFSVIWKKVNKKPYLYPIPTLTLFKGKSALFTLKIEIQEKPKKLTLEFKEKDAEKYLSLNLKEIGDVKKGKYSKYNYLKITCKEAFSKEQILYVKADDEICGALRIHPNDTAVVKKINVVIVKVKTDANGSPVIGKPATGGKAFFSQCMSQALVSVSMTEEILDCTGNFLFNKFKSNFCTSVGGVFTVTKSNGLREYLEDKVKSQFGNKYDNHYRLYFIGESGNWNGFAYGNSKFGVYFKTHNKATIAHETMHAMNLPHTFASISQGTMPAKYTYQAKKTNNIMDYSHLAGIERFCSYYWHWKILNSKIN